MKSIFNRFKKIKSVYLDFASTTPVDNRVLKAMSPYWSTYFFNPSASYTNAQNIKKIIKESRIAIASHIGVKESEVIFTQGGTESINIALIGCFKKIQKDNIANPHILISSIEHPAVTECIEYLKSLGAEVEKIPVNKKGVIDTQEFEKMLKPETVLVSVISASNETGVVQPIHKLSSSIKKFKNSLGRTFENYPYIHTDASQLTLTGNISISKLGVDMITIDGSKIYAPKMSGVLIKKQYVELEPIMFGGGQEKGLRPGTESVVHIVGITKAINLVYQNHTQYNKKFSAFKNYFIQLLDTSKIPYEINGEGEMLPHILNICIKSLQSDFAVIQMDEYGIECAAMTSCAGSKGALVSEVLNAMDKSECAGSSLRFSFGLTTSKSDIKKAVHALQKVCIDQKVV